MVVFYSDMSDCPVELEGEGEDVVVVAAVTDDERPVRFVDLVAVIKLFFFVKATSEK